MKIVSWNINSVRLHMPSIENFVAKHDVDILCLQETKVIDELFPHEPLEALGFTHRAIKGQKSYNGVAIVSKHPLSDVVTTAMTGKDDCRHISASVAGLRVHNFYVPAGGDVPDVDLNEKFKHKLDFMQEMTAWAATLAGDNHIVMGDLNIAPLEHDVWSSKALKKTVSHTPIEREMCLELFKAGNFIDVARMLTPEPEKLYSWWSYRSPDWLGGDKGRRLDHMLVSSALKPSVLGLEFFKESRGYVQPSDHVPVVLSLNKVKVK